MTEDFKNRVTNAMMMLHGWCTPEKAHTLCAEIELLKPKIIVEIGVYAGKSLIPMAMACEEFQSGFVLGIDPWSAAASVEGYDTANANWWGMQDHEKLYRDFMSDIARLKLENRVIVQRVKSDEACVPDDIGLLHIDGQHSEQAIRDVKRFAPKIVMGGLCVMDDIDWSINGATPVATAVNELLALGFSERYRLGTGAVFVRHPSTVYDIGAL